MAFVDEMTEIIRRAGGFTPDASLEEAIVIRKQGEKEKDREFERLSKMQPAEMREDEYEYFKARTREGTSAVAPNPVDKLATRPRAARSRATSSARTTSPRSPSGTRRASRRGSRPCRGSRTGASPTWISSSRGRPCWEIF